MCVLWIAVRIKRVLAEDSKEKDHSLNWELSQAYTSPPMYVTITIRMLVATVRN